jgi:hypothetical protein
MNNEVDQNHGRGHDSDLGDYYSKTIIPSEVISKK